jgi:hypothetical protein
MIREVSDKSGIARARFTVAVSDDPTFARAEIVTAGDSPALTVPPAAIVIFAGIEKVFVVENGKAVEYFEYYDTAQVHAAVA